MTVQELWKEGNRILTEAGIEEATLDSRYLLEWVLECNHSYLLLNPNVEVRPEVQQRYQTAIQLRQSHTPLQYITGEQEFMGYSFQVNEHVLIPRQDTEVLVETVLKHLSERSELQEGEGASLGHSELQEGEGASLGHSELQGCEGTSLGHNELQECEGTSLGHNELQECEETRILDMCCGSGCIGISLWKMLNEKQREKINEKKNSTYKVTLSDVSPDALAVTKKNVARLQADVQVLESDLFEHIEGRYQLIVSNPPYIPSKVVDTLMPEVREHEPRLALDGTEDGLFFYRKIIEQAKDYLEEEGYVFFEIGFDQAEDIRKIFVDAGFEQVVVKQDLAGLDRVVYAKFLARSE